MAEGFNLSAFFLQKNLFCVTLLYGDNMERKNAINSAYDRLKYETPLKFNCGKLCECHCCKGEDTEGMILFPGEEKLFEDKEDFSIKTDSEGRKILICSGICDRKERPISCRMYPLFPLTYKLGDEIKQKVIYDVRGMNTCPIVTEEIKTDRRFVTAVRLAGKELIKDEDCLDMILKISEEILDIIEFNKMISGE